VRADDFKVLRAIIDGFAAAQPGSTLDPPTVAARMPGFDVARVRAHCDRLQRLGLIAPQTGNSKPFFTQEGGEPFVATPLFVDVEELLRP
jgi:hypothetical protein